MAFFKTKFESTKQDWTTPHDLFDPLNEEFGFTLDAAASAENTLAPEFFSKDNSALEQDWGKHIIWLNPPYGMKPSLADWVKKAYHSSLIGATTVLLIPARTNTIWFHHYCLKYGEVRFVKGRPKFGGAYHGLPQPLCLVIFRPPTQKADSVFQWATDIGA
jgi:phage N-6-adenine-methyltransferase